MTEDKKPKTQQQLQQEAKDARLNKALRDNLRRRKAATRKMKE